ncbi:MAG: hypothetical protein IT379_37940 [Deltaproteobacteria bacterium]|nr:hypothetical protein [Deltaproteobacteria bacterium]
MDTFATWRASPPPWSAALGVPPHVYALSAGWELTPDGGRRDLCSEAAYRLDPTPSAAASPIVVAAPSTDRSPWLDRPLTILFDLPTALAPLDWLRLDTGRLVICTDDQATCFTFVHSTFDGRWANVDARPDYLGGDESWPALAQATLHLSPHSRSPLSAAWQVCEEGMSQLGGFPTWWSAAAYPTCPGCRRHMRFVGQLETSELLGEPAEGLYYAFVCADCRFAATGYQQT